VAFEVPQRDPCPFCENVAGRPVVSAALAGAIVDCAVVDDTRETFAFIPPRQRASPHVLVIPTRHAATILDLAPEEAAAIMRHVHRVAAAVTRAFQPAGLNIFQNNGMAAGQSVGHYHVHIVPRYADEPVDPVMTIRDLPLTPLEERRALAERIRRYLPP